MPRPGTQLILGLLRTAGEDGPSDQAKLDLIQSHRRDKQTSRDLDRLLITEISTLNAALKKAQKLLDQLRVKQEELRQLIEKLRAPPLRLAVFLGWIETAGQVLAKVAHGVDHHLVAVDGEAECSDLAPGATVCLSSSLGLILGRAENGIDVGDTATVERRLSNDRLILRDRDEEVVVQAAEALHTASLEPGDQVLWSRQLGLAFAKIPMGDSSPRFLNIKDITEPPPRIGGLHHNLRRLIATITASVARPELARRYGVADFNVSILLFGPPGCGKTLIAQTIAFLVSQMTGFPCRFVVVNGAELESPFVGQTQANIRRLFKELNGYDGPTILFIDEVEAIGRHRGGLVGQHQDRFLSAWLTSLGGFQKRDRVAVIAATNRKDLIDGALLERISGLEMHIGRPNRVGAREIFEIYLPIELPYQTNGTKPSDTRLAAIESAVSRLYDPNSDSAVATLRFRDGKSRTVAARDLLSGRAIKQICVAARQRAFQRVATSADAGSTAPGDITVAGEGIAETDMSEAVDDFIEKVSTKLSVRNAHHYLPDLSEDADVVSVEPVRRRVRRNRYLAS